MALNTADPGQTMTVNFTVENEGGQVGEQDILLTLENGNKTTVDQLDNISLEGGVSNQYSLVWDIPSDQEEQIYELSVETDDDIDVFWDPLGAFDATQATGVTEIWSYSDIEDRPFGASKDYVSYLYSSEMGVLDSDSGNVLWSIDSGQTKRCTDVSSKYAVYGDEGSNFYGLSVEDGSEIFSYTTGSDIGVYHIDVKGELVVAGDFEGEINVYDMESNSISWTAQPTSADELVSMTVQDGYVYSAYDNDVVSKEDLSDGSNVWKSNFSEALYSVDAHRDNLVVLGWPTDTYGMLYELDMSDGSIIQSMDLEYKPGADAGVSVHRGAAYAVGDTDELDLQAFNLTDGNRLWRLGNYGDGKHVTAYNDKLFRTTGRDLIAYDIDV